MMKYSIGFVIKYSTTSEVNKLCGSLERQ